jgi:phospholipid/cholesterol/gamma-HCH transport system substrate-binding protein
MSNEIKVGIFVFVALILITILVFGVGEIRIFEKGYRYHVVFNSASGLDKGTVVKKAGVRVGTVKDISFIDYEGVRMVDIIILVDEEEALREGDKIYVTMTGFLGDYYVRIVPGMLEEDKIEPGSVIEGEAVAGIDETFTDLQETMDTVQELLDEESIQHLKSTMEHMDHISADLDYVMAESKDDIVIASDSLRRTSLRMEDMIARNEANFDITLANAAKISEDAVITVENFRVISEKLNNGEGSAGLLLNDDTLYNEMTDTSVEAKELIRDVRENPTRYIHISLF